MKKISFVLALLLSTTIFAQDFQGTLSFKISYDDMSDQMKAMESMLPKGSKIEVRDGISRATTPNGMGGSTIILTNNSTGDMITLTDMMGNKIAMKTNMKDLQTENKPEIEYLDETKEILGYKCKKAIVTISDGENESEIELFYTEELDYISITPVTEGLKGMLMEMTVSQEFFTMTQTITEVKKGKVKKIKMEIPSDYQEMTQEELIKLSGGGGM